MRVLALVPYLYDTAPGQRFRFEQWAPLLEKEGIFCDFVSFEDKLLHATLHQPGRTQQKMRLILRALTRRLRLLKKLKDYDVVLVHREAALVGPPIIERAIARRGVPMIYDFDDAIFLPATSEANKYMGWLKFHAKTSEIISLCQHVMAGNEYLADFARQSNRHVTIVPTTIDTDKYTIEKRATNDPPIIGWSGSFSTVQYLETLRPALEKLATQEAYQLRVIGTPKYDFSAAPAQVMAWKSASEVSDLRPMDIGVMPLPDDQWTRGKCGLKGLQYMALGIATVMSPVGVNSDIIRDGQNGFLAATEDEWLHKLGALLRDDDLRRHMGQAGR
jgi:glycosyltransferase involved in cell wall biosynthesis